MSENQKCPDYIRDKHEPYRSKRELIESINQLCRGPAVPEVIHRLSATHTGLWPDPEHFTR